MIKTNININKLIDFAFTDSNEACFDKPEMNKDEFLEKCECVSKSSNRIMT